MQTILNEPGHDIWQRIAPWLDAAVAALGEKDRRAIVLRFYEGRNLREVGVALGASEDAAEKRVARALEKLRKFFSKRGVSSTTATLAETISANSRCVVPVGLAKAISAVAVTKGATASTSILTLIKGALKMMVETKAKTAVIAGAAVILATGTTALLAQRESQHDSSIPYKVADDAWQVINSVDKTNFIIQATVTSRNKTVKSAEIHLTIESAKGPIPVRLGTNGQVIYFPHDEALRRENPLVTANQPGGTLSITIWGHMPIPDGLVFRYDRLGDMIAEVSNTLAKAKSKIMRPGDIGWADYLSYLFSSSSLSKGKVQGVIFEFPKSSARKATVEIMAAAGTQTYRADANGQIKLRLDPFLLSENPEIRLSERPRLIGPDLRL